MKFLTLITLTYITSTSGHGLTIIDTLNRGKEPQYFFNSYVLYMNTDINSHMKELKGVTFKVHLEKSKTFPDDTRSFLFYITDLEGQGSTEIDSDDLTAAYSPIIVKLGTATMDIEAIHAGKEETQKSLSWKLDALMLLTKNLTFALSPIRGPKLSMDYEFNSIGGELRRRKTAFGDTCRVDFSAKRGDGGDLIVKYHTKKSHCVGKPSKQLLEHFKAYNMTEIAKKSELTYGFTFYSDRLTKSYVELDAHLRNPYAPDVMLKEKMSVEFMGFKKATDVMREIDESVLDVVYKELQETELRPVA